MKRRELLRGLTVLPLAGGILGTVAPFESKASPPDKKRNLIQRTRGANVYQRRRHLYIYDRVVNA